MNDRYEVKFTTTDKDGKEWLRNCGVMFPHRQGGGFSIIIEAPTGTMKLAAFPAKERDQSAHGKAKQDGYQRDAAPADLSDDVPF